MTQLQFFNQKPILEVLKPIRFSIINKPEKPQKSSKNEKNLNFFYKSA